MHKCWVTPNLKALKNKWYSSKNNKYEFFFLLQKGGNTTLLKQFSIILCIYFLGELIQKAFELPIPGNVLGMFILFFGLCTGIIKLNKIEKISDFLLDNMAFFFLPASVSLITFFVFLKGKLIDIIAVSFISTFIILIVTGYTVELVQRLLRRKSEIACCMEKKDNGSNNKDLNRMQKEYMSVRSK